MAGKRSAPAISLASGALFNISKALKLIRKEIPKYQEPVVTTYGRQARRPAFKVLISCILSLRTRDEQTRQASARLFAVADTPEAISAMEETRIEKLIYPVGFYRTKAGVIRNACRFIVDDHGGDTPDTIEELLEIKGVGRKTANLVVTEGHGKPGICVDTHVHRICNIWGYVANKTPDQTEMALREKLPARHWIEINNLLVTFGQNVCKPVSPICSRCPLEDACPKIGVKKSR
ncbi:MAG: endonuclease III [Nitrospinota bacterium]|nr:endonuclease III [Nitrospinota bacterium]